MQGRVFVYHTDETRSCFEGTLSQFDDSKWMTCMLELPPGGLFEIVRHENYVLCVQEEPSAAATPTPKFFYRDFPTAPPGLKGAVVLMAAAFWDHDAEDIKDANNDDDDDDDNDDEDATARAAIPVKQLVPPQRIEYIDAARKQIQH